MVRGFRQLPFVHSQLEVEVLAEEEGFEPSVDLHLRLISSQVHSTALPPLRSVCSVYFNMEFCYKFSSTLRRFYNGEKAKTVKNSLIYTDFGAVAALLYSCVRN